MAKYKSGEAFIDILNAHGVDKIFINPGFESIDVLTNVALAREEGRKSPQLVLCLDESVTAAAAYGNHMITGKPQVVMVHSELGTLQLGANLINLQWGRIPAVILAGHQGARDLQRTTWDDRPFDQGSIVRNSVKYDRRLNGDEDIHEVLAEAFSIACTEPTGPVYLCFPMNYFSQEIEKPLSLPVPKSSGSLPDMDMGILNEMADILLAAKNPLLVSGNAGRYPQNVGALVALAETLRAPAITGYSWMNFPSDHPLCIGIEQIGGSRKTDTCYAYADVILAIDYAMPYVGSALPPKPETKILHIDIDPTTQGRPLWGRGADIFMKTDARKAIPALDKLLKDKITASISTEFDERFRRIAVQNEEKRKEWYEAARSRGNQEPISTDYLFYCLSQLIDEDTIVVNHTLSHCASVTEQIVRSKPGTWFGCPSGSIGWAPGAALGASSASPGKTVVSIMTDGGFVWGCPTSAFWTSANYRFPFLTVVCNNRGYAAIRDVQYEMIGNPHQSERFIAESALDFTLDYAMTAQAAGAFGRVVTKPEDVMPALREALSIVRSGKSAVLDVHLPREK